MDGIFLFVGEMFRRICRRGLFGKNVLDISVCFFNYFLRLIVYLKFYILLEDNNVDIS